VSFENTVPRREYLDLKMEAMIRDYTKLHSNSMTFKFLQIGMSSERLAYTRGVTSVEYIARSEDRS
jgi:hypothetical protein